MSHAVPLTHAATHSSIATPSAYCPRGVEFFLRASRWRECEVGGGEMRLGVVHVVHGTHRDAEVFPGFRVLAALSQKISLNQMSRGGQVVGGFERERHQRRRRRRLEL